VTEPETNHDRIDPAPSDAARTGSDSGPDSDSTVGTGSFFALGCTLITLIIVVIGVAIFILRQAT
jgi:hypothetical protein